MGRALSSCSMNSARLRRICKISGEMLGIYQPLSRDLFNAAFVSCWTELYDQYQEELVRSIVDGKSLVIMLHEFGQIEENLQNLWGDVRRSKRLFKCASLAGIYQPLSRDLFNAAFVSCWTELYDQYQEVPSTAQC
jgi:phosphatidylinositol kinase/protein kinase (PI-3  family)